MAILIAMNSKPSTRQYVWDCFIKTAEIISSEKAQELENTSLGRNVLAKRISNVIRYLTEHLQLSSKIFQTYTIVVDESTDVAQLAFIICGCNAKSVTVDVQNRFPCMKLLLKRIFSLR